MRGRWFGHCCDAKTMAMLRDVEDDEVMAEVSC